LEVADWRGGLIRLKMIWIAVPPQGV